MRNLGRLLVIVTVETTAIVLLVRARSLTGQVPLHGFMGWVRGVPPEEAIVALARIIGLALGWWSLATTALYIAARVLGRPRLIVLTGRICFPLLRRAVDSAFAAGLVAAALAGPTASVAKAAPATHAVAAASATVLQPAPSASDPPKLVVRKGDSLWRLAERNLGDGRRYPVLWEANRGHTMTDGKRFTDPDLIHPGWQLHVRAPAGTARDPAPVPPADPPVAAAPTVDSAPVVEAIAPVDEARAPHPSGPPGVPSPGPPPPTTPTQASPAAEPSPQIPTGPQRPPARQPGDTLGPLALSGLGAAVVLASLHRARRLALRRRSRGDEPTSPILDRPAEAQVRAVADGEALRWADAANRLLAAEGAPGEAPLPSVQTMRVGALGVELLLDQPALDPPNGFVTADDAWVWRVDPDLTLEEVEQTVAGAIPAMPALVEVGQDPDGAVLIDLEHVGRLALRGPQPATRRVAAHLASQLVGAPWARGVEVRAIGDIASSEVLPLEEAEAARTLLADVTAPARRVLWAGAPSTLAARRDPATRDLYPPVVLIADHDPNEEEAAALADLVDAPSPGVALVLPDHDATGGFILDIDEYGHGRLEPLGLQLVLSGIEPTPAPVADPPVLPGDCGDLMVCKQPGQVEVLVLGPLDLVGTGHTPHRAPLEGQVLIRLAFEGRPYSAASLREDLYPLGTTGEQTFATTLKRARRRFGEDADGQPLIGSVTEGKIATSAAVTCDWHRFQRLAASGDTGDLRTALALVRGEPFAELPIGYEWVTSGLIHRIQARIADVAQTLSATYLAAGAAVDARWAADQGLLAVPESEPLRIARVRAEAAVGDLAAVRRTVQEIHQVAADLEVPILAETEAVIGEISTDGHHRSNQHPKSA